MITSNVAEFPHAQQVWERKRVRDRTGFSLSRFVDYLKLLIRRAPAAPVWNATKSSYNPEGSSLEKNIRLALPDDGLA